MSAFSPFFQTGRPTLADLTRLGLLSGQRALMGHGLGLQLQIGAGGHDYRPGALARQQELADRAHHEMTAMNMLAAHYENQKALQQAAMQSREGMLEERLKSTEGRAAEREKGEAERAAARERDAKDREDRIRAEHQAKLDAILNRPPKALSPSEQRAQHETDLETREANLRRMQSDPGLGTDETVGGNTLPQGELAREVEAEPSMRAQRERDRQAAAEATAAQREQTNALREAAEARANQRFDERETPEQRNARTAERDAERRKQTVEDRAKRAGKKEADRWAKAASDEAALKNPFARDGLLPRNPGEKDDAYDARYKEAAQEAAKVAEDEERQTSDGGKAGPGGSGSDDATGGGAVDPLDPSTPSSVPLPWEADADTEAPESRSSVALPEFSATRHAPLEAMHAGLDRIASAKDFHGVLDDVEKMTQDGRLTPEEAQGLHAKALERYMALAPVEGKGAAGGRGPASVTAPVPLPEAGGGPAFAESEGTRSEATGIPGLHAITKPDGSLGGSWAPHAPNPTESAIQHLTDTDDDERIRQISEMYRARQENGGQHPDGIDPDEVAQHFYGGRTARVPDPVFG